MGNLKSLSLFVGTDYCNANCNHCAGVPIRGNAPKEDGIIDENLIYKTIKECYALGARSMSISSAGEPTLSPISVTKTLGLIKKSDLEFKPINLYSNGIRIGNDKDFCDEFLPSWKSLDLATFYITVHDVDEKENARIYGIKKYPSLDLILSRIHDANLLMRANLVLSKNNIGTFEKFVSTVDSLKEIGVDYISAWPIRNLKDEVDKKLSPLEVELDKMENWARENQGQKFKINLLMGRDRKVYETGQKLTLFPNGILSNAWCN